MGKVLQCTLIAFLANFKNHLFMIRLATFSTLYWANINWCTEQKLILYRAKIYFLSSIQFAPIFNLDKPVFLNVGIMILFKIRKIYWTLWRLAEENKYFRENTFNLLHIFSDFTKCGINTFSNANFVIGARNDPGDNNSVASKDCINLS